MNLVMKNLNAKINLVMTFENGFESRNEIFNEKMNMVMIFEKGNESRNEILTKKWTLY